VLARKWSNNAIADSTQDPTQSYLFPEQRASVNELQCHRLRSDGSDGSIFERVNVTTIKQAVVASIADSTPECVSALWCDSSNDVLHTTAYQHIRVRTDSNYLHSCTSSELLLVLEQCILHHVSNIVLLSSNRVIAYCLCDRLLLLVAHTQLYKSQSSYSYTLYTNNWNRLALHSLTLLISVHNYSL
jgi:hypothetical protein